MEEPAPETRRFRLDVAYDGRPFAGWQSQAGGNTIQDLLLAALQEICAEIATVQGSGRTDAGVSASGQVAHFDVPSDWRMGGEEWRKALNTKLPATIRVVACRETSPEFHARSSALGKTYRYGIFPGEVLPPLLAGLSWHRRGIGSADDLAAILRLYEGTHDFRAFSANRGDGRDETRDTVRTISRVAPEETAEGELEIRVSGDGFLYKMVRFLVGTAVYCYEGKISEEEIRGLLRGEDRDRKAPYCAPPDGLTLEEVHYPPEFE